MTNKTKSIRSNRQSSFLPSSDDPFTKAVLLDRRGASYGFEWDHAEQILEQIDSEVREVRESINLEEGDARLKEELSDILFATISLCDYLGFDLKEVMEISNHKYEQRLDRLEALMREKGIETLHAVSMEEKLALWRLAKIK